MPPGHSRLLLRPSPLVGVRVFAAAAFFFSDMPGMVGGAALLLWALSEALSLLWATFRRRPHLLVTVFGEPAL